MFVRVFSTALDPSDLPEVRRIFTEDIKPVFESIPGCRSMELLTSTASNAGGLADVKQHLMRSLVLECFQLRIDFGNRLRR